jgi:hypothetical protein
MKIKLLPHEKHTESELQTKQLMLFGLQFMLRFRKVSVSSLGPTISYPTETLSRFLHSLWANFNSIRPRPVPFQLFSIALLFHASYSANY